MRCMKQIKPEEVFETVKLILKTGKDERFEPCRSPLRIIK